MSKVHYGWGWNSNSLDEDSKHICGTRVAEFNYYESPFKELITCKKCLKNFDKYKKWHEIQEEEICNQMGEMADFYKSEEKTTEI